MLLKVGLVVYIVGFVLTSIFFIKLHLKSYQQDWELGSVIYSTLLALLWPLAVPLALWYLANPTL
jgi:hypothetical protein